MRRIRSGLLPARRQRPRSRAADERDELAPSHACSPEPEDCTPTTYRCRTLPRVPNYSKFSGQCLILGQNATWRAFSATSGMPSKRKSSGLPATSESGHRPDSMHRHEPLSFDHLVGE